MSEIPDAVASITVPQPHARVWTALTDPDQIAQYFFGTRVVTEWQVGGHISWQGEWQGKQYEDRGKVLEFTPLTQYAVTHYSPMTGLPDVPESYHTVTYTLSAVPDGTTVTIRQGNNRGGEVAESEKLWMTVLDGLKRYLADAD